MEYPTLITFKDQPTSSRLMAFLTIFNIKQILLIPHMIAMFFWGVVSMVCALIGVFAVLFTGKYPVWAEDIIVGTYRWMMRIYTYYVCMTDKYPPFTKDVMKEFPVEVSFKHEESVSRLSALMTILPIKIFLLIPHFIVMIVLEIATIVSIILGVLATLFMGRYPVVFSKVIVTFYNYCFRLSAYLFCMTDKYPPISWN